MTKEKEHKGYKLRYYSRLDNPNWDNRYQTFYPRPYDNAEYWWAYTYDKSKWIIVFDGKIREKITSTFENVIDIIYERNKSVKKKMIHN